MYLKRLLLMLHMRGFFDRIGDTAPKDAPNGFEGLFKTC